jgi:hypothetical protein
MIVVVHQFGGVKLSGLALHDVLGELEHVGATFTSGMSPK